MDRKDAVSVIESGDGVEPGTLEKMAAEWCTSTVCHRARRKNEADATTALCELQRAFDEKLIAIDV
jgi:hypothetical protein